MESSEFPGFEASRELPFLVEGNQTIETVANYVDATVYRDPEGMVRGLKKGFLKEGGGMVTAQGDDFSIEETGKLYKVLKYAAVPVHEAVPIETRTVTLENGDRLEISSLPAGKLFSGDLQPGQPLFVEGSQSLEGGIVAPTMVTRIESELTTMAGETNGWSMTTTRVEICNPLAKVDQPENNNLAQPRKNAVVKTMTPDEYKNDPSLHLITKISRAANTPAL